MKKPKYIKELPKIEYYPWQDKVLATKGNLILRSGRQVGKSEVISEKAARYALENSNKTIMVIAFVEKQASLIFAKILNKIHRKDRKRILGKENKPTKHRICLDNGTEIYCYAAGETGYGIMGYTIDLLIADEAAFINEEVWNSVIPTLAATQGDVWLLSTPKLMEGFYYDCFEDPSYSKFHESSQDCPHITKEFLEDKKRRFTKGQYSQMYLGEFVENAQRFFSDEWIDKVCVLPDDFKTSGDRFLGVDIAAMGEDSSTFEGLVRSRDKLFQFHHETTEQTYPTETERKIIDLNAQHAFEKVGIDSAGMGIGVLAHLLEEDSTKDIIVGLDNSVKAEVDKDGKTIRHKEAMHVNLLLMGERKEIQLFDSNDVRASLRSIIVEENGSISGRYSHIVEGLIRAAWLGKEKDLNPTVYTIKV